MERAREIEILIEDGCTRDEAERLLKNGTTVFNDFEENFDLYMDEWKVGYSEDDFSEIFEQYKNMIETKIPITDWGVVESDNHTYYIMYVL